MAKRRLGLALSGGGSRGAYQAGAWWRLEEAGVRPDAVAGTSVGALNGAMLVSGMPGQEMAAWWRRLRQNDILRRRRDWWRVKGWQGIYDPAPLRRLLEEHLDVEGVQASSTPLLVTAVDLESGEELVFSNQDLTVDHFLATTALPPALPPVRVDGRLLVDGGASCNLPLQPLLHHGCKDLLALLHDPTRPHASPAPRRLRQLVWRTSDLYWHSRVDRELKTLPRGVRFHEVAPDPPLLPGDILRFDPGQAARLVERGYGDAEKVLDAVL